MVCPIFAKMVLKDAQDFKVKSQRVARSKNFARSNGRGKCRGGGWFNPPPAFLGLTLSYPVPLRVEFFHGPDVFRIVQQFWDGQIQP